MTAAYTPGTLVSAVGDFFPWLLPIIVFACAIWAFSIAIKERSLAAIVIALVVTFVGFVCTDIVWSIKADEARAEAYDQARSERWVENQLRQAEQARRIYDEIEVLNAKKAKNEAECRSVLLDKYKITVRPEDALTATDDACWLKVYGQLDHIRYNK